MSKDKQHQNEEELSQEELSSEETQATSEGTPTSEEEHTPDAQEEQDDQQKLLHELNDLKDSHLRLMAEYDNYRKRTLKEKSDLIKYGGEKTITAFLEVLDDFDLALKNMNSASTHEGMVEGMELIQHKLISTLKSLGTSEMEVIGTEFNPEEHDAVAIIPAPEEGQKGKVIDCIQKGYILNDKVIRHAKVVVGQ